MARTKTIKLVFIVVALVAALMLVVGCSSSSSSSAASASAAASTSASASASAATGNTLEGYFKEHLAEWETTVAQIKEKAGDVMDVDMTITGNRISQIMTYKQTYSDETVAQLKAKFEEASANLKSQTEAQIKAMEDALGVKGITWYFAYCNGDGKVITDFEYGTE